ncbi:hypothetical protein BU17DRAFT_84347 [Hysterangium stoloniferum]|nr:hypothetical protein BU17DRAFT_84347 [Hysterangium stoloniferum]
MVQYGVQRADSKPVSSLESPHFPSVEEKDVFVDGEAEREADAGPSDVFGRRMHSSRIRRTTEMDELFDRLKESVDLCGTDWERFCSRRHNQPRLLRIVRRRHKYTASIWICPTRTTAALISLTTTTTTTTTNPAPAPTNVNPPPIYSLLLTYLMPKLRVSHRNPRVALALFAHAKQRSVASYGLGTAAGDNEGLEGVESVLREMNASSVGFDSSMRAFVEEMESGVVAREREWEGGRGRPQAEETVGLDVHEDKDGGGGGGRDERWNEAEGSGNLRRKDGKMVARRKHWDEEWKMEGGEAGLAIGEEDELTLE